MTIMFSWLLLCYTIRAFTINRHKTVTKHPKEIEDYRNGGGGGGSGSQSVRYHRIILLLLDLIRVSLLFLFFLNQSIIIGNPSTKCFQ